MQNSQDLTKVQALRDALNTGDEKRIKAQRDAGKLTARERIEKLVDNGSFVETYALVSENGGAAGVVTGYATIQNRPVYLFAQDFTVHETADGKRTGEKCGAAGGDGEKGETGNGRRSVKISAMVVSLLRKPGYIFLGTNEGRK